MFLFFFYIFVLILSVENVRLLMSIIFVKDYYYFWLGYCILIGDKI